MLVIPRRKEVLRINGSAQVVMDDELVDMTTFKGRRRDFALLIRVEEAFFRCGKTMIRSAMWQPDQWAFVEGMPSYTQALN